MTMMKVVSVLKALAQLCLRVIHNKSILHVINTIPMAAIVPVKADTSLDRAAISHVRDRKAVISLVKVDISLDRVDISHVNRVDINHARVDISHVNRVDINPDRVRKAVISPVKVDTSSVRVVIRNHTATSPTIPIRKGHASTRQTTIRMLSIA
jgi:hypothetical protein